MIALCCCLPCSKRRDSTVLHRLCVVEEVIALCCLEGGNGGALSMCSSARCDLSLNPTSKKRKFSRQTDNPPSLTLRAVCHSASIFPVNSISLHRKGEGRLYGRAEGQREGRKVREKGEGMGQKPRERMRAHGLRGTEGALPKSPKL